MFLSIFSHTCPLLPVLKADDAKAKFEEKERKKREIRQRLEAQMKSTKKKGFMTPERKKRLRVSVVVF